MVLRKSQESTYVRERNADVESILEFCHSRQSWLINTMCKIRREKERRKSHIRKRSGNRLIAY